MEVNTTRFLDPLAQVATREQKAKPALEAIAEKIQKVGFKASNARGCFQ